MQCRPWPQVATGTDGNVTSFSFTLGASENDGMDWSQASCSLLYNDDGTGTGITVTKTSGSAGPAQFTIPQFAPSWAHIGEAATRQIVYRISCIIQDKSGNQPTDNCTKTFIVTDGTAPSCGDVSGVAETVCAFWWLVVQKHFVIMFIKGLHSLKKQPVTRI